MMVERGPLRGAHEAAGLSRLPVRAQSQFRRVGSIEELLAARDDAVYWVDAPGEPRGYLKDLGDQPCIYKLHRARYFTGPALSQSNRARLPQTFPLPEGVKGGGIGLLLTAENAIFPESFYSGICAHAGLEFDAARGDWQSVLPEMTRRIEGPFLFAEIVPAHFGHAIVEMPARLWPLDMAGADAFAGMDLAALGTHGLSPKVGDWPGYTRQILAAIGAPPDRVTLLDGATEIAELYVPSRVAPFRAPSGPRYAQLMQKAGRRIAAPTAQPGGDRLYLSRSNLAPGHRSVGREVEREIEAMFAARGFRVFHPQEVPLADQIATVRQARCLAGLIGSQLHLAAFCGAPGPHVFRIAPSSFRSGIDGKIARETGGSLTEFVVEAEPMSAQRTHRTDWRIGPDALDALPAAIDDWLDHAA